MKTKLLFLTLVVVCLLDVNAQQSVQASLSGATRTTPIIGFNTNGHLVTNGNWLNQSFIDSSKVLNPGILRYPGGTNANYWDWQTGWFLPQFQRPYKTVTRVEEFKKGVDATGAEGLYVLNYRNSNVDYQLAFLRHTESLGLPIKYIEIGNEHNIKSTADVNQYVAPDLYGADCKIWGDSIKKVWPNAKICLVGGSIKSINTWHQPILDQNPDFDAFAWHVYTNANNADLVFDVDRAIASAFSSMKSRYAASYFPANKEIWITEYNLWETQPGGSSQTVIAETWANGLYVTAMNHFMLQTPQITMMLNHSLTSIDDYHAAINRNTLKITANGVAMKLLMDSAEGQTSTEEILFNPNLTITNGTTTYPKLIGWKFSGSSNETGFICNFSSDSFNVSLSSNFINSLQYDQYAADPTLVVNGMSSLTKTYGISSDVITIAPYSITQIKSDNTLGITALFPNTNDSNVVISTKNKNVTIDFNQTVNDVEISIYNLVGQQVLNKVYVNGKSTIISVNSISQGFYLLNLKMGNTIVSKKIYID